MQFWACESCFHDFWLVIGRAVLNLMFCFHDLVTQFWTAMSCFRDACSRSCSVGPPESCFHDFWLVTNRAVLNLMFCFHDLVTHAVELQCLYERCAPSTGIPVYPLNSGNMSVVGNNQNSLVCEYSSKLCFTCFVMYVVCYERKWSIRERWVKF